MDYSQAEIINMIGEKLISPAAYSLGCLPIDSPYIVPILRSFSGSHLHLYGDKNSRPELFQDRRLTFIPMELSFPRYLTPLSPEKAFYDYAVIGEIDRHILQPEFNIWPRVNIGGIMILKGNNIGKTNIQIRIKKKWVIVMGCCRGATEYIYRLIKNTKRLSVFHQCYGLEGIIGGEATGTIYPTGSIVVHQVRSPLGVIASASMRAEKLSPYCAPLIGYDYADNALLWAMHYWYQWNRIAARKAQWTYRVEDIDNIWDRLCQYLGITNYQAPIDLMNVNSDQLKPTYPHITWEVLNGIDAALTEKIRILATEFGYDI